MIPFELLIESVENKELNRDFRRQTAAVMEKYAAFIATHLEIGMQVRYCRHGQVKHPLLRLGDIGAVVKINGKNVHVSTVVLCVCVSN